MGYIILLVEDEAPVAKGVRYALEAEGWRVVWSPDAADALRQVATAPPALAILDVRLPGMGGLELCREIRRTYTFPVMFLTARDEEVDRVLGLELGADDYLTKPFAVRELVARVRALLRRAYGEYAAAAVGTITLGEIVIDSERRRVTRSGRSVNLTATEFDLLLALARHPGRVLSREALLRAVRDDEAFVGDETTVTVHIRHLRAKLEERPDEPQYIVTVRGVGYTITTS